MRRHAKEPSLDLASLESENLDMQLKHLTPKSQGPCIHKTMYSVAHCILCCIIPQIPQFCN